MVKVSRKDLAKIEDFQTVRRWLRDKAAKTRYSYLRNMVRLTRELKLNPDQFLSWTKTKDSLEVWDRIEEMAEAIFEGPGARFNFKTDMRSFLVHNGYTSLPKAKNGYSSEDWHRGYRKEELRKLVGYLDTPIEKLFCYLALETGLRAKDVLAIRYRHVKQDLEAGVLPVAVRFEKSFYGKKKSAGYAFIGARAVSLLKDCIAQGLVKTDDDSPLIPRKKDLSKPLSYSSIHDNIVLAAKKAGVPSTTQPSHGIRKYFEGSLDRAEIDDNLKDMLEGHFEGTRAKNYTDREWDNPHSIREAYTKAYPFIDLDAGDPQLAQTVQSWQEEKAELKRRIFQLEEEKKNLVSKSEFDDVKAELRRIREDLEKIK
jgi:integrase